MFTFIRNAIAYCVAKVKAAYQAVVNFFFAKEEKKENKDSFKTKPTSEETKENANKFFKISNTVFITGVSLTEENVKEVMDLAEEMVKGSEDKVELAAALFYVTNTLSLNAGSGGGQTFAEMTIGVPVTSTCGRVRDRIDSLVSRFNSATVTKDEYEVAIISAAALYVEIEVGNLKAFFKGNNK